MNQSLNPYEALEEKIGVTFVDRSLLKEAFVHRSYLNEHRDTKLRHNERLEFLGDAVLELVITEYLFKKYPDDDEGKLTAYRSALVNTNSIAEAGVHWGLNEYLLLSKGEAKDTGRARQYILANCFEAVIGAIYLDQGYDPAKDFIGRTLFTRIEDIVARRSWQDAKSQFQEEAQERVGITPSYAVIGETGPDHEKRFVVGVYLGKDQIATADGMSKQDAEQKAAQVALEKNGWVISA